MEPKTDDWYALYGRSLKSWIVPDAFKHPAKFSRKLIEHIYAHCLEEGWLVPGSSRVLDPMAGVATGGVAAANAGLVWEGIELERHFLESGLATLERHRLLWERMGKPLPVLRQGDARQLGQTGHPSGPHSQAFAGGYSEPPDVVLTSPPYADAIKGESDGIDWSKAKRASKGQRRGRGSKQYETFMAQQNYGADPTRGQIGALSPGDVQAVIFSPPYVGGGHHPDQTGSWGGLQAEKAVGLGTKDAAGYGQTAGQVGKMPEGAMAIVTSPPYNLPFSQEHSGRAGGTRGTEPSETGAFVKYGNTPGQIEGLPEGQIDAVVTRETYWVAMRQVYAGCFALLPVGGHIVLVLKGFVRKGAYVDLPGQTCALLEAVGFRVLHRHRAWLIAKAAQLRLDGGEDRREHKSIFRRIQERRGGPRVNFEEVVCAEKAEPRMVCLPFSPGPP